MTIDYIMISFVCASVSDVCGYLFDHLIDDFKVVDSNMRGFQSALTNGVIFIHYENKGTKPVVLLEIRSAGCRFLEEQADHSWRNFFQQLTMIAKHVSIERYSIKRMDIAIDSYTKETLSPTRAESYLKKRLVTSRFRVSRTIKEYHVKTAEVTGDSIYFGRRTSDLYIIVYDKQLESDSDSCWFRLELCFRNLWGTRVMAALLGQPDTFSEFIADVLEANIQFRSSIHKRSEVRRQPLAKWYLDYLSYVRRQTLYGLDSPETRGGVTLDD